jgi:predicted ABC-type transport system involved in lysophospholipase L1 biosynthesis ATPase subunit
MKEIEFKVGDKVQLTGQFLRSTGQVAGGEGQKVWTVKAVKTYKTSPAVVIVDEPAITDYFSAEELAADPSLAFRRILSVNLKHYGKPSLRDVY